MPKKTWEKKILSTWNGEKKQCHNKNILNLRVTHGCYVDPCSALPLGFCCTSGFFHLKRCSLHEVGHPGCQMMQSCGGKSHCSPSFSWCLGGEVVKISQGDWEVQKLTNHWCGINHGRIGCRWQSWILLFPAVLSLSLSLSLIFWVSLCMNTVRSTNITQIVWFHESHGHIG